MNENTRVSTRASVAANSQNALRFAPLAVLVAFATIVALLPKEMLRPLDLVGYAVCHRIAARSFFVAQTQLPVCARDTGMFSGALLGLIGFSIVLRSPAARFPARPYAFLFAAFFLAWAFDGLNSYWLLATGRTLIYQPQNWLRLTTGALMGIALSAYVVALFNQAVWRRPDDMPSVARWRDVAWLTLIAGGVIAAVLWRPDFLYGPLALLSSLGVLVLLTIVNGLLALIVLKRHGTIERWSQLVTPAVAGFALTLLEIALIDALRAALTQNLRLPY
jgi:uncharacterized membrane protein